MTPHPIVYLETGGVDRHAYRGIARYVNGLIGGFEEVGALGSLVTTDPTSIGHVPIVHSPLGAPRTARSPTGQVRIGTVFDLTAVRYPLHVARPWQVAQLTRTARELLAVRRCDHVVTIYESTARDLHRLVRVPRTRTTVIVPGIDRQFLDETATRSVRDRPLILSVGAASRHKNLPRLLRAHAGMASVDAELALVGLMTERQRSRLKALAAELGTESRVRFLGAVSDDELLNLYRSAAVFVLVSLWEGFGLPILEAMAVGCPVVCSNTSSMPEVVGGNGILVDPTNPAEIAAAIDRVLADDELSHRLTAGGRERAEGFTWSASAARHVELYLKMAADL